MAATPTGVAEGEQLLVGHLRGHGLAVEPPALADEEVAGVDDLLHLAERLGVGLADLARDQARERLLVVLDEPAELLDRAPAHGRGHGGPLALGRARRLAGGDEGAGVAEQDVGDGLATCRPGWWRSHGRRARRLPARPAMIEATVRDMALNLACACASSPSGAAQGPAAAAADAATDATPPRSCPSCSPASLLAPAAAQAATPGVNIVGSADVATRAGRRHRRQDRARVRRAQQPARHAYRDLQGHPSRPPGPAACGVVFVLVGNPRRRHDAARPGRLRGLRRWRFAAQMKRVGRRRRLRGLERGGRDRLLGRGGRRGALRRDPQGRLSADQGGRPEREGAARAADRQQLQLPGPDLRRRRRQLVRCGRASTPTPPASSIRRAPSTATGGNVARFTFLGFRTVHDVMVANGDGAKPIWMTELGWTTTTTTCARGMWAGQKPSGVDRGRAGGQPQGGLPLPGRLSLRRGRDVVHPQGLQPATATSSTTTGCSASTARTSPPGTRFHAVATQRRPAHRAVRRLRRRRR